MARFYFLEETAYTKKKKASKYNKVLAVERNKKRKQLFI